MGRIGRPPRSGDFDAWAPHALAIFFGWGSLLAMLVAVLPGREMPPLSGAIAITGLVTAGALLALAPRLTPRWLNLVLLAGTACVALGVSSAVTTTGPDAVLFVWVGLYAGFFLGPRWLALHVVAVGTLYGLLLWVWPGASIPMADTVQGWVLVVGSVAAAGVASAALRGVGDGLVSRHRALASTDALTGLANRPELLRRGDARRGRPGAWAMLLIDLDDFKSINDVHGHDAGDRLLGDVAGRIAAVVREHDVVARLGGDEFAVLVDAADGDDAERVAGRIHRALAAPVHGQPVHASVGVVAVPDPDRPVAHVLRDADIAMYAAKREHGGWKSYTPAMHADVVLRRDLQRELEDGLDDQLHVAYQPIVAAGTGEPVLVEALARWTHPRIGVVSPGVFIPIAEASGLIFPLGHRVLQEACHQAARWPAVSGVAPVVSVNIAPPQLLQPGLVETVHRVLEQTGLAPERLMLEVTETSVMTDPERAGRRLRELRDLGVRLAVDDFGTGHSSLAYLQRLPVTDLKLAREFVSAIGDSPRAMALARGVIGLGHALGLRVVAEGVEEPAQQARLCDLGCDLLQGFLFARPMDADAVAARLARVATPAPAPAA